MVFFFFWGLGGLVVGVRAVGGFFFLSLSLFPRFLVLHVVPEEHLHLPGWHPGHYLCTRCSCTPEDLHVVDDPLWRRERWTHWDLLGMLHELLPTQPDVWPLVLSTIGYMW